MKQAAAILAAVAATPAVIAVSFALLSLWQLVTLQDWSPWLVIYGWAFVSMFAVPAALVVALAAVPLVRRYQPTGGVSMMSMVRLGVVLGVLPFLLYDGYVVIAEVYSRRLDAPGRLLADVPVALKWATLGGLCGAGSASAYWAVLRDR